MSLLTKKHNAETSNSKTDWNPKIGWHEARIVAIADVGAEPNKYQDNKMQDKVSICFAFDETVEFEDGTSVNKTKVEKMTASLHEKSNIVTKILSPAGISVESFDEMLGKTLRLKLAFDTKTGKYLNIVNADETERPLACPKDMYVPKFWLLDKEGNDTGFDILAEDGVIVGLLPKKDEVSTDSSKPVDEEDMYA